MFGRCIEDEGQNGTPISQVKLLSFECQASGMYAKRAKQATKKRQRRGLLVFSELPSLSLARQPIGLFPSFPGLLAEVAHTGFSGLIRLFKKKSEDGQSNSSLFAIKRSTAPHGSC
jgi:hypothetical protein